MITRTIHPEVRVQDQRSGICDYIASDETLDRQQEIIRAKGWRFDEMAKNPPFIDSHRYGSIECQIGKVLDAVVQGDRLIETVQWAIDVPQNRLAQIGWAMTSAGYLKAVSVGFRPTKLITRRPSDQYDSDWTSSDVVNANTRAGKALWQQQQQEIGSDLSRCATIYLEQQQHELSACILGANPNALAKSYKAGVVSDSDLDLISAEYANRAWPAETEKARQRALTAFLVELESNIRHL